MSANANQGPKGSRRAPKAKGGGGRNDGSGRRRGPSCDQGGKGGEVPRWAPGATALELVADGKRMRVLETLEDLGRTNLSGLAARSGVPNSTLSDILPRLVESNLVSRWQRGAVNLGVEVELLRPGVDLLVLVRHAHRIWSDRGQRGADRPVMSNESVPWIAPLVRSAALDVLAALDRSSVAGALQHQIDGLAPGQLRKRVRDLAAAGFVERTRGRRKQIRLHDTARLAAVYVVRAAHLEAVHRLPGATDPTPADMAAALRILAPLLELAPDLEGICELAVTGPGRESIQLEVKGGAAEALLYSEGPPDGLAEGTIAAWCEALLEGRRGKLKLDGDRSLGRAVARALHESLPWR